MAIVEANLGESGSVRALQLVDRLVEKAFLQFCLQLTK
jgi:hypothetical protein